MSLYMCPHDRLVAPTKITLDAGEGGDPGAGPGQGASLSRQLRLDVDLDLEGEVEGSRLLEEGRKEPREGVAQRILEVRVGLAGMVEM